jgi:hypothetical protein
MFDNLQHSTQVLIHVSKPNEEAKNDNQMTGTSILDN